MDRFMLHLKNSTFVPEDASKLLKRARELSSDLSLTVRDTRVSSKYLEYDISIEKNELESLIEKLTPLGTLDHAKHVVEEEIPKNDAIKDGIFYFNNERFWECHEVLEGVWKKCYEGEKDLVQGIILVAAALVHYQKNENDICLKIFVRALEKLENANDVYFDIDIDRLRDKVSAMIKTEEIFTFEI